LFFPLFFLLLCSPAPFMLTYIPSCPFTLLLKYMSAFLMHIFINMFHKQLSHHINRMYVPSLLSTWGQKVKVDHPIQVLRNLYIKIQHLFANILQSLTGIFMSIMELLCFRYVGTDTLFTTTYDWLTPCVICSWHLMTD
jgi:hypothetical protein